MIVVDELLMILLETHQSVNESSVVCYVVLLWERRIPGAKAGAGRRWRVTQREERRAVALHFKGQPTRVLRQGKALPG